MSKLKRQAAKTYGGKRKKAVAKGNANETLVLSPKGGRARGVATQVRRRQRLIEMEDAEIAAGIAADPDTFEPSDEEFAKFRPAEDVVPEIVAAYRRSRGLQKSPTKEAISIRLDRDVLERFRATGDGWQSRINDALRKVTFGT